MASTMAQATARQTLGVAEDNMEISSDAGGNHDNDIDIDIDFYDGAQVPQDDYMEDQGDDLMVDDDLLDREHGDGFMQDIDVEDEELHDVDVDGDGDTEILHEHGTNESQPVPNPSLLSSSIDNAFLGQPESVVKSLPTAGGEDVPIQLSADENYEHSTNVEVIGNQPEDPLTQNDITPPNEETKTTSRRQSGDGNLNNDQQLNLNANSLSSVEPFEPFGENRNSDQPQSIQPNATELPSSTVLEETTAANEPHTAEPLIHPIMLSWKGQDNLLFPFESSNDSYFANTSLLDEKFGRLFIELRQCLEGDLEEESKLELEIEVLSLTIGEDSSDLNDNSLGDVLDIYQTLCHNDGKEIPDTLFISLREKVHFLKRLEQLHECISIDLGLSQVQPQFYDSYSEHEGDEPGEDAEQSNTLQDTSQAQKPTSPDQGVTHEESIEPNEQATKVEPTDHTAYHSPDAEKTGTYLEKHATDDTQHDEDQIAKQTSANSTTSRRIENTDYNDDIIDYSDEEEGHVEADDHEKDIHTQKNSSEDTTDNGLSLISKLEESTNHSGQTHDQAKIEDGTPAQNDDETTELQPYTDIHEEPPANNDDDGFYLEKEEDDLAVHEQGQALDAEDPEDEWRLEDEDETTFHSAANDALELSESGVATDQIDFEQDLHLNENDQDGADEFDLFKGDIDDDLNGDDSLTEDFVEYNAEENGFNDDAANLGSTEPKQLPSTNSSTEQLSATSSKKRSRHDQEDDQDGESALNLASKKARPD